MGLESHYEPTCLANTCAYGVLCRDGEELTFVSERDGNLELYQQKLSKERRSEGEGAAEGEAEASVQRGAAPKRLTYAVSMQVRVFCSGSACKTTLMQQPVSGHTLLTFRGIIPRHPEAHLVHIRTAQ